MQEAIAAGYQPARAPRARRVELRGLEYRIVEWGPDEGRPLVLLHGWMDCAMSFQFVVDAFAHDRRIVAPDLRGFGESDWQPQGYWFPDYLADVDALLDRVSPGGSVDLVGHSLGGNVALLYAGVRPARVRRVVSLDGFGVPDEPGDRAPDKIIGWLDALRAPMTLATYPSIDAVAERLRRNNRRLAPERAEFLARHWARPRGDGGYELLADPRHKIPFPTVHRLDQTIAVWRRISAPTLWIAARDSAIPRWLSEHPEGEAAVDGVELVARRMTAIAGARLEVVEDAGHMLHHDQPESVARLVESFVDAR